MGVWLCSSTHQDQAPDGGSPSNLANNAENDPNAANKVEMKMEDSNQGLLGESETYPLYPFNPSLPRNVLLSDLKFGFIVNDYEDIAITSP